MIGVVSGGAGRELVSFHRKVSAVVGAAPHRRVRGALGRKGESGFGLIAVLLGALSCAGPIPVFYWAVIDPIANARELGLVREGLAPLLESLRAETRRAGHPPEDVAPVLAQQDAETLRSLGVGPSSPGFLRYFSGPGSFALAARGTPAHRDSFAVIVYTPWDDRWVWKDASFKGGGDHRAWLGAAGKDLQEWECLSGPSGTGGWTCERYPRR